MPRGKRKEGQLMEKSVILVCGFKLLKGQKLTGAAQEPVWSQVILLESEI